MPILSGGIPSVPISSIGLIRPTNQTVSTTADIDFSVTPEWTLGGGMTVTTFAGAHCLEVVTPGEWYVSTWSVFAFGASETEVVRLILRRGGVDTDLIRTPILQDNGAQTGDIAQLGKVFVCEAGDIIRVEYQHSGVGNTTVQCTSGAPAVLQAFLIGV